MATVDSVLICHCWSLKSKLSRTADKGWPSSFGIGRIAHNSSP